ASRAQDATEVWPPAGILWAFGIEKDQVVGTRIRSLQESTRVVVDQSYERRKPRAREVGQGKPTLVFSELDRRDRAADRPCGPGKPEGGVAIRRADFQHPKRAGGAHEHGQEFAGVTGDVEHEPRALARRGIVRLAEALELGLQRFKRVIFGRLLTP